MNSVVRQVKQNLAVAAGNNSRGQLLIEVLIALMIFSVISTAFMGAIYTSRTTTTVVDEQSAAESLTRSEMEYVKESPYWGLGFSYQVPGSPPPWDADRTALDDAHPNYSVSVTGTPIYPSTHTPMVPGLDHGMQEITVTILRDGRVLMTTQSMKVNR